MHEARVNRYHLLTKFCNKNNILHLFLGHHKDDNLETFINRKISGSDFVGLQSINENVIFNKTNIIRPLLNFTKKNIYDYNKKNKIFFIEDPSNTNLNYTRPIIRKYLKNVENNLKIKIENDLKLIKKLTSSHRVMISEIIIDQLKFVNKNEIRIEHSNFLKVDHLIAEQILKKIYLFFFENIIGLRSRKIQMIIERIQDKNPAVCNLKGMIIKKNKGFLIFSQKSI